MEQLYFNHGVEHWVRENKARYITSGGQSLVYRYSEGLVLKVRNNNVTNSIFFADSFVPYPLVAEIMSSIEPLVDQISGLALPKIECAQSEWMLMEYIEGYHPAEVSLETAALLVRQIESHIQHRATFASDPMDPWRWMKADIFKDGKANPSQFIERAGVTYLIDLVRDTRNDNANPLD